LTSQVEVEQQTNLQLTGQISPKLDSNSTLLLECDRKCEIFVLYGFAAIFKNAKLLYLV